MKKLINLIKEIQIYHTFKPSVWVWRMNISETSYSHFLIDQTHYNGSWFKSGYFIFINTGIRKLPGIIIKIVWWRIDVFKNLKLN